MKFLPVLGYGGVSRFFEGSTVAWPLWLTTALGENGPDSLASPPSPQESVYTRAQTGSHKPNPIFDIMFSSGTLNTGVNWGQDCSIKTG